MTLVLASASPRRLDLLRQVGFVPAAQDAPAVDETPRRDELPPDYARRMAEEKARAVAPRHPDRFVLAGDTVVACGRRILPKAEDEATAHRCLTLLSGRRHRVHGGICLITSTGACHHRLVTTQVAFKRLEPSEIRAYLDSGEWHGKAGGYAIQGCAAAFVRQINGSYSNVVGLPLFEVTQLLRGVGLWPCT